MSSPLAVNSGLSQSPCSNFGSQHVCQRQEDAQNAGGACREGVRKQWGDGRLMDRHGTSSSVAPVLNEQVFRISDSSVKLLLLRSDSAIATPPAPRVFSFESPSSAVIQQQ